ncbi:hypothetical protein J1N35_014187 [Gossypium stocksii]|uniref:Reverse transcriptase zinc-binding domain-containing protein n=1 Tax=Gossypium stocksii TaxID=47602 RepID=A0A9D4A9H3_9ROSI|nr:hypothetical protein J1N35_014187 [Gossypium stocksii]
MAEYLVRSGHKILAQVGQTQVQDSYRFFYKRLWTLDLPSKNKIMVWRSSRNYLPNYSNLHYRRIMGTATCRRCQEEAKTMEHLFRNCAVVKETWERLDMGWVVSEENTDFIEWLKSFLGTHFLGMCRKFVCALWGIWTFRNKFIHEGERCSGAQIAGFVTNYLKELDGLKESLPATRIQRARWVAPLENED